MANPPGAMSVGSRINSIQARPSGGGAAGFDILVPQHFHI